MAQHKKKQTPQQNQKILAAQQRKDFLRKIKVYIDNFAGEGIYSLIPTQILDSLYQTRGTSFKFVVDKDSKVSDDYLKLTKIMLTRMLRANNVALESTKFEISISDYFITGISCLILDMALENNNFKQIEKVKEAMKPLSTSGELYEKAFDSFYEILHSYTWMESNIAKRLYWLNHECDSENAVSKQRENIITIHSHSPEIVHFDVDGISRSAIRLNWAYPFSGIQKISISPDDLNLQNHNFTEPLDVFIQSHAINRLHERIDCFLPGMVQYNLVSSIQEPKVIHYNNKILIECRIFGNKVGYLVVTVEDDILLIRTFLFLTHNGTPEGNKLEAQTGLQKLDKVYLQIDKLSTFMLSDLGENKDAQEVLKLSDCQSLVDMYFSSQNLLWDKDQFATYQFDDVTSYLKTNKVKTSKDEPKHNPSLF